MTWSAVIWLIWKVQSKITFFKCGNVNLFSLLDHIKVIVNWVNQKEVLIYFYWISVLILETNICACCAFYCSYFLKQTTEKIDVQIK